MVTLNSTLSSNYVPRGCGDFAVMFVGQEHQPAEIVDEIEEVNQLI